MKDKKIFKRHPELRLMEQDMRDGAQYLFHKDLNILSPLEMSDLMFYIQTGIEEDHVAESLQQVPNNDFDDGHHYFS